MQANIKALLIPEINKHEVMNMACGDQVTLIEMVELSNQISYQTIKPIFGPERIGDVKHSKASINKIAQLLKYYPSVKFKDVLEIVYNWYKINNLNSKL